MLQNARAVLIKLLAVLVKRPVVLGASPKNTEHYKETLSEHYISVPNPRSETNQVPKSSCPRQEDLLYHPRGGNGPAVGPALGQSGGAAQKSVPDHWIKQVFAHVAMILFSRSAGGPYETPMGLPYETPMKPL